MTTLCDDKFIVWVFHPTSNENDNDGDYYCYILIMKSMMSRVNELNHYTRKPKETCKQECLPCEPETLGLTPTPIHDKYSGFVYVHYQS